MADGTTVNRTSGLFPVQHLRQSETRGAAHMDFSEHLQSLLDRNELTEMDRIMSFEKY